MASKVYIEQRQRPKGMTSLAADITLHLFVRQLELEGKAVVIAKEPFLLLRVMRKQWLRLTRDVQRERARTLNAQRIVKLSQEIAKMQSAAFSIKPPSETLVDLYFLTLEQAVSQLGHIHTVYVTHELDAAEQRLLHDRMQPETLIVLYSAHHK